MATKLDYYSVLQVHPLAEKEVIDAAYRKLAAKYHPDVSRLSDATARMKRINAAYEVLSDPVKRAAYDAARDMAPSPDTPPHVAARSHRPTNVRRTLKIAAGLLLLAFLALRLGPMFLLVAPRLVVAVVVIALVVWLLFTLAKPRR